jgi:hypothetical protein
MSRRCWPVVAAALALASLWAEAETIYRCGHEYTDVACPHGSALAVGAAPSAQQRAEAAQVVLGEKRLAAEMTHDRRECEAALQPALASSLGPARPPVAPAAPNAKAKHVNGHPKAALPDDGDDFIAAVPKTKKPGG